MTIAMILEMMAGKAGCILGKRTDATPFEDCDEDDVPTKKQLEEMLHEAGFPRGGEEMFINGMTGEMFRAPFFVGTCYYQKLKHMVKDKIHSRSRVNMGPIFIWNKFFRDQFIS